MDLISKTEVDQTRLQKKALVTGASGFIGRVLCHHLRQRKFHVRALLRQESRGPWDETCLADLSISTKLPQNIVYDVDVIFHLASKVHALSELVGSEEDEYHLVNVNGTRQLLQMAEAGNVSKFIFFSSLSTMREAENEILDERDSPRPKTHIVTHISWKRPRVPCGLYAQREIPNSL